MAENLKITIKAFDKTQKAFGGVTAGLKSIAGSVFSMKTALVGLAGAAGFGLLVKSSLNATDSLSKTASKLGTTTESLSKLRYAADLTGVSTQTMDMAMQRFTRRTAEAAKGTGEAKGAIKELGLNAKELVDMPLEERMLLLSDAFSKQTNESDKLRLAFKLFDSEGAALVNTLGAGSGALRDMFNEAESLGLVMSQQAASGVEDTVDSITKLKGLMDGFISQTVAAFAPAVKAMTDELVKFGLTAADGNVANVGQVIAKSLIGGLVAVIEVMQGFMNAMAEIANQISSIYRKFFPTEATKELEAQLEAVEKKAQKAGITLTNSFEGYRDRLSEANKEIFDEYQSLKEQLASLDETQAKTFDFSELINKLKSFGVAIEENIKKPVEDVEQAIQGSTVFGKQTWLDKVINSVATFSEGFQTAFHNVKDNLFDFDADMQSVASSAIGTITSGFTDAITGAKSFGDAMKSMAKSVVDSLIKMFVQYQITQPLFKALFGEDQSGSGGIVRSLFGKKAIGGSVQAGQPYMVGERGPEMFVPNSQGSIVPNNKMGGGGGVVVNQTINVTTGVQQTVRAEIATLMPQIANAAKGAVADARMRGGGYSKALVGA